MVVGVDIEGHSQEPVSAMWAVRRNPGLEDRRPSTFFLARQPLVTLYTAPPIDQSFNMNTVETCGCSFRRQTRVYSQLKYLGIYRLIAAAKKFLPSLFTRSQSNFSNDTRSLFVHRDKRTRPGRMPVSASEHSPAASLILTVSYLELIEGPAEVSCKSQ